MPPRLVRELTELGLSEVQARRAAANGGFTVDAAITWHFAHEVEGGGDNQGSSGYAADDDDDDGGASDSKGHDDGRTSYGDASRTAMEASSMGEHDRFPHVTAAPGLCFVYPYNLGCSLELVCVCVFRPTHPSPKATSPTMTMTTEVQATPRALTATMTSQVVVMALTW